MQLRHISIDTYLLSDTFPGFFTCYSSSFLSSEKDEKDKNKIEVHFNKILFLVYFRP